MKQIKVSSKGQVAIPKSVREALNLKEGSTLTLEIRGQQLILSREAPWKKLRGAASGNLMEAFAAFKKREREREDSRS